LALIMIPLASAAAKSLGKRIGKVSTEAMVKAGALNTYLIEIFKNHKLIKIFQREHYEKVRTEKSIKELMEKSKKIAVVFVRASPIMETLTGIMIAALIYYSGKLIINNELGINNFFSFLAAMMLAYQPVRSLATINIAVNQGLVAADRIFFIIDEKNKIEFTIPKGNGEANLFPDIIIRHDDKTISIYDVKYKKFKDGVDREDRFQLTSYVAIYSQKYNIKECGFIYPTSHNRENLKQTLKICNKEIPFNIKFYKVENSESDEFKTNQMKIDEEFIKDFKDSI